MEVRQSLPFSMIPNSLIDSSLEASVKMVYVALARFANRERSCWPSIEKIAKVAGLSKRWVIDLLPKLEDAGFVKVTERNAGGRRLSNSYTLLDPMVNSLHHDGELTSPSTQPDGELTSPKQEEERTITKNNDSPARVVRENVIAVLNTLTNSSFRPHAKASGDHINARLKEGYSEGDLVLVVRHKATQWLRDEKMSPYLRPSTLFSPKFEGYLQEARRWDAKRAKVVAGAYVPPPPITDDEFQQTGALLKAFSAKLRNAQHTPDAGALVESVQ